MQGIGYFWQKKKKKGKLIKAVKFKVWGYFRSYNVVLGMSQNYIFLCCDCNLLLGLVRIKKSPWNKIKHMTEHSTKAFDVTWPVYSNKNWWQENVRDSETMFWPWVWTDQLSALLFIAGFVFKLLSNSCSPRLQVLCVRMCAFYTAVCLAGWPPSAEAARLRCGSDLLSDLIFVCGDRGIYLGKSIFMLSTFF